jgi:SsrA-binding protein
MNNSSTIVNRQARFNYEVLEIFITGIVLVGPEVLSVREGKANISEAFCMIENNEIILKNMHISKPNTALAVDMSDEFRDRKLLMKKSEIKSLYKKTIIKGNSLIPLKVFRNKSGLYKVELGLCKGKKDYDKRETLKEKDAKRDIERSLKNF